MRECRRKKEGQVAYGNGYGALIVLELPKVGLPEKDLTWLENEKKMARRKDLGCLTKT